MRVSDAMLPRLAQDFGQGITSVSAVVSLFAIAYGIMQFAYGPLGDRLGKLRVIAVATMAGLIGNLICALAPVFPLLLAGRVLSGATAAAVIPLSMAWIGDQVHYSQRQTVLARFLTGQMMGFIGGQFAGGWFSDTLGWRGAFFTLAAIFLTVGLVLWQRARHEPRPTAGAQRRLFGGMADVVARPWARVVLATVLIEGMVFFGCYAFVPFYLHERFSLSLTHAGLIAATLGLGGLVFSFSVHVLVPRLGETGLAVGGGSVLAAGLALIAFAPSPGWAIPGCFACGVGFYMLHNTLQLNATQMAPEHRGTAVSLFASMLFLGQAVGVSVAGLLVPHIGVRTLLDIGAATLFVVGLTFFLRLRAKHAAVA